MKTFQDLTRVGASEYERGRFCVDAINNFRSTIEYQNAKDGEAYYNKHNITIEKFQKVLFTLSGNKVPDVWSSNYKLKTLFFRRLVLQQVQYVLGNGVILEDVNNKEKLGKDFDFKLQTAAKRAMASGKAFGFWNLDHLEVFGYADTPSDAGFCPLYDEDTSKLRAGIRFWYRKVGDKLLLRATLYEEDGYTDYSQYDGKEVVVDTPKRAYKITKKVTLAGGVEDITEENYTSLPIIPLYANDAHESELIGLRESIDCYDFIKSGLANNIDDSADIYWLLENTGGMDDVDLAQFIQRMRTVHAATVDNDGGSGASAHTVDVPTEARKTMLEILRKDIYEDFQALDVNTLSAAQKTTQEIQAAYQNQDNKCADFEYYIIDFVQQILELAGIDDNPSFNWNRVINQAEQTAMILNCANILPEDLMIKKLPFLTPEEAEQAINDMTTRAYESFNDEEEDEEVDEESRTES